MSTTVKVFRSTETGAPSLAGNAAGSLINVLDACLVTGYGGGTPSSITRSGSTATVSLTGHTWTDGDVVLIAGAEQSAYNGEFPIFNVTSNAFDITVTGTPATPATGTITVKKAPAGWTKPHTGTNKAAFRLGAGSQAYLRIDDSPAQYPRVVGYSSMTDVDTGSNPFPSAAQFSGGLYWARSNVNDAVARPWMVIANDRVLHLWIDTNAALTAPNYEFFGDIASYMADDACAALLIGNSTNSNGTAWSTSLQTVLTSAATAHYMAGSYNQIPSSITVGKHIDTTKSANVADIGRTGTSGIPYPNPADGGLYLSPVWVHENANRAVRGHMPGLWASCHLGKPLTHGSLVDGAGALAGRKFLALDVMRPSSTNDAQVIIEVSSTWYA